MAAIAALRGAIVLGLTTSQKTTCSTQRGAITPPFGYIIFALKAAVPEVPLATHYRAAWLFVWITVAGMVLFTLFPWLVTGLPVLLKK